MWTFLTEWKLEKNNKKKKPKKEIPGLIIWISSLRNWRPWNPREAPPPLMVSRSSLTPSKTCVRRNYQDTFSTIFWNWKLDSDTINGGSTTDVPPCRSRQQNRIIIFLCQTLLIHDLINWISFGSIMGEKGYGIDEATS